MRWQMTSILLTLSCICSREMKQVEVTCHLMHAAFSGACFYTLFMRKWMAHGDTHA
jgi:hypothetical protein